MKDDFRRIDKPTCDRLRSEIHAAGLSLKSSSGDAQLEKLPKLLEYLGGRGLGTIEGEALGYRRIATRIKDLKQRGFQIHTAREGVISDDGLPHHGMARYHLLGYPQACSPSPANKGGH